MSTTSAYSSNKLKQVIDNETQHFIVKSYITAKFDYDRAKPEYHLYWYNDKKGVYEDIPKYQYLSFKELNKKEKKYFDSIRDEYFLAKETKDGCVWENKKLGFNRSLVRVNQYKIEFKPT